MKPFTVLAALAALTLTVSAQAEDVKSGLQPGKRAGAFYVTKCAGANEDGVEVGKELCYRCRNGARPQVMVFTTNPKDKNVVKLIQELDKAIAGNTETDLRAFVNIIGEDKAELDSVAKEVAKSTEAKNVPFVVPNEFENGPANYGLNPKAEVTVILAKNLKVEANHAATSAKDLDVKGVIADFKKIAE